MINGRTHPNPVSLNRRIHNVGYGGLKFGEEVSLQSGLYAGGDFDVVGVKSEFVFVVKQR